MPHLQAGALNPVQARFFSVIFILSILLLGWVLWPFWQLLIFAFLLAGIFRPIYTWLGRWLSPWLASLLTCILIVLIVFVPLTFCIIALSTETLNLYQLVKDTNLLAKLQQFLQNNTLALEVQGILAGLGINFDPGDLTGTLSGFAGTVGLFLYNQASFWAGNIMSFVLQFIVLIMVAYFLLIDMDRLLRFLMRLSPLPQAQNDLLLRKFMDIAGAILVVNGISGVIQGVIAGAYFALLGLPSPVLWGSVMGVLAFLPIFGIGLVLVPTAFIFLVGGHLLLALSHPCFLHGPLLFGGIPAQAEAGRQPGPDAHAAGLSGDSRRHGPVRIPGHYLRAPDRHRLSHPVRALPDRLPDGCREEDKGMRTRQTALAGQDSHASVLCSFSF